MGVENTLDIRQFKNIHKGERGFILGTGPSMDSTNLSLIKNEILIGVNDMYYGYSKFGITCKYYCISDHFGWLRIYDELYKHVYPTVTALFLGLQVNREYKKRPDLFNKFDDKVCLVYNRETGSNGPGEESGAFSTDLYYGTCCGFTVVFDVGLQLAHYMGFDEVYLVGVDTDWTQKTHHFLAAEDSPTKAGWGRSGQGKQPPHVGGIFAAYLRAKKAFEREGRKVYNATRGGKLEVFDRVKLEDVVSE